MSQTTSQGAFLEEVCRLRAAYQKQRDSTNLVPPTGRPVLDQQLHVINGITYYTYWYDVSTDEDASRTGGRDYQVIQLADIPGTLSGAILRLERNIPLLDVGSDYEIAGDDIRRLTGYSPPMPEIEDDSEDTSAVLASLPEVEVDPERHFVKAGKYTSEVQNLLACQGGSCPGAPRSAHVIQLLGRSPHGELVFDRFTPRYILAAVHPLSVYKAWIRQLVEGLQCLHSLGIVHRDLRIDNLVFSRDGSRLLICDLESRWGNRLAPEVSRLPVLGGAGWTEKSDIYDLGITIKGMIYGNTPVTNVVEWHAPSPLDVIVASCTCVSPDDRPSLDEITDMVERIDT